MCEQCGAETAQRHGRCPASSPLHAPDGPKMAAPSGGRGDFTRGLVPRQAEMREAAKIAVEPVGILEEALPRAFPKELKGFALGPAASRQVRSVVSLTNTEEKGGE